MASEEWVFEYEKKQETQSDFDSKLEDRFEGMELSCEFVVKVFVVCFNYYCHAFPRSTTKFETTCMTRK